MRVRLMSTRPMWPTLGLQPALDGMTGRQLWVHQQMTEPEASRRQACGSVKALIPAASNVSATGPRGA